MMAHILIHLPDHQHVFTLPLTLSSQSQVVCDLSDFKVLCSIFSLDNLLYSGRGKFMPLPLKSKILETPGFLVTDYIKMFPL
jgi:hypothetical protein